MHTAIDLQSSKSSFWTSPKFSILTLPFFIDERLTATLLLPHNLIFQILVNWNLVDVVWNNSPPWSSLIPLTKCKAQAKTVSHCSLVSTAFTFWSLYVSTTALEYPLLCEVPRKQGDKWRQCYGKNALGGRKGRRQKHHTRTERDSWTLSTQSTNCKSLYSLFIAIHKLNIKCNWSLYIHEELHKPLYRAQGWYPTPCVIFT